MTKYAVASIMAVFLFISACKKTETSTNNTNPTIKAVWTFRGLTDSTSAGTIAASTLNGNSYVSYSLPGDSQHINLMFYHARPLATGTYILNFDYPPQAPDAAGMTVYVNPQDNNWYNAPQPGPYGNQYSQPINATVNGNVTTITGSGIVLQNVYNLYDSTKINFVITQTGQ